MSLRKALIGGLICAGLTWAQTGTGNIQGTVKDPTGAVLPGAKVTLTHTPTSRVYNTTTTEVGFYLFPSVQMGPYEVAVEAAAVSVGANGAV